MIIHHEAATYRATGLSHYDGNPMIEALPPLLSDEEVVDRIASYPELPTEAELELSSKFKAHCVGRMNSIVLPLEIHLRFELRFAQVIREGYISRHPFSRDTVAMRHAGTAEHLKATGFKSSAKNLTLVGLSGMGKTTMLDAIMGLYPQVIRHSCYQGRPFVETQVTWLKIECPHDGSPRGLCAAFFAALDTALGTEYSDRFMSRSHNISMLMQRISQLCRTYYIGALVVDEFQHLGLVRESGDRFSLLNFFVTLSNDSGVPIFYSGTNAMFKLFSGVVRNARRALGEGEFFFDRFDQTDEEWELLVAFLLRYNWTGKAIDLNARMYATIYDLSQGNTDFLVKLLTLAQWQALYEDEAITNELLQAVYDKQMTLLHRAIEALRSDDPDSIRAFEDLMPAKDQVALMMNNDIKRRIRRSGPHAVVPPQSVPNDLKPADTPASNRPSAATSGDQPHLVGVPPSTAVSEATEIVEAGSWDEAMKEKGWVAKGTDNLW